MRKYFLIFKLTLMDFFVYRFNFFISRFRSVVSFLTLIFFWQAVYGSRGEFLGYQRPQMLTYVIGISFLGSLIRGKRIAGLAGVIKTGELASKYLIRPWSLIKAWFSIDAAAKALNTLFVVGELFLIVKIFKIPFYLPKDWQYFLLFLISCLLSILLYFLIDFWISMLAFWVDNVWAPRWLLGIIFLEFMSGSLFPLDVLPGYFLKVISLTPFPYIIFFPLKIYLGQVEINQAVSILLIMAFWLILFIPVVSFFWKKGLKVYTAYGG